MAKYKAKKGFADNKKALSVIGNNKYQKLITNQTIEIDSLPKEWDEFVEPVSNNKPKKEDKE